jgi:YVTN family beta-propeller protein
MRKNCSGGRAFWARGFLLLGFVLAMVLPLRASPADHRAYVANASDNTVSVIDTDTNTVVATISVGPSPSGVFVSPYGSRVFVGISPSTGLAFSVIDAAANKAVATFPGSSVAFSPDGTHAYVGGVPNNSVQVIDLASNTAVATIPIAPPSSGGGASSGQVAATPDGTRVFAVSSGTFCSNPPQPECGTISELSEIKTNTNAVVDLGGSLSFYLDAIDWKYIYFSLADTFGFPILVSSGVEDYNTGVEVAAFDEFYCPGGGPYEYGTGGVIGSPDAAQFWVICFDTIKVAKVAADGTITTLATFPESGLLAFTPDSKRAYIVGHPVSGGPTNFYAIDTSTFAVVVSYPLGGPGFGTALGMTRDGKQLYVVNRASNAIEVISTATNDLVARIPVGKAPVAIGIMPNLPLSFFSSKLVVSLQSSPYFELLSSLTLGSGAAFLDPSAQPVTVQAGTFGATIPPGSFKESQPGEWDFDGTVNGTAIHAKIWLTGTKQYLVLVKASTKLAGITNPVPVTLTLLNNSGTAKVTAAIYN